MHELIAAMVMTAGLWSGMAQTPPESAPPAPSSPSAPAPPLPRQPDRVADRVAEVIADRLPQLHGSAIWRQRTAVQADLNIKVGEETLLEGTLMYETNRRRARIELKQGGSLLFDGYNVHVLNSDMDPDLARKHLEVWTRVLAIPFKLRERGVEPRMHRSVYLKGNSYDSITLIYKSPGGKETGDWRYVYSHPKTHMIRGIANEALHGFVKDAKPDDQFAVMLDDYTDVEGVKLATRWTLWRWDNDLVGEPIGSAIVSNIKFVVPPEGTFEKPRDTAPSKQPGETQQPPAPASSPS